MEDRIAHGTERLLFFRRYLANPGRVAALLPSSGALAELIASHVPPPGDGYVLELGAGTGAVTEALARRVRQERLLLVEIDEQLCACLRKRFPRATVIRGDVARLAEVVPQGVGRVTSIVSGLPVAFKPLAEQRALFGQCMAVSGDDLVFLQYTYMPFSPYRAAQLGLRAERLAFSLNSFPPIFIWRFTRKG